MLKVLLFITIAFKLCHGTVYLQPQQVHIAFGGNPSEIIVNWVTFNLTKTSVVEYGTNSLDTTVAGKAKIFIDGGTEKRKLYMHTVTLSKLTPGQTYYYHCGSDDGWSNMYKFTTMKAGTDWSPRLAVYGDMGNVNGVSIPRLQEDIAQGMYDAILHVGDFAYNFDDENARRGDEFMRQLEPIAASVPYMVAVGNHENKYNFSNYDNRFTMTDWSSGSINNHFYSFNMGPAHFIAFSSEYYFYTKYGWNQIAEQYKWLVKDLKEATKPENRAQRPWIITYAHRPIYCDEPNNAKGLNDCSHFECLQLRHGVVFPNESERKYGLEKLFYDNGVDLQFWAHQHFYERLFPVYDMKVRNGTSADPYFNPRAPVHIVTGSAGCQERHSKFSHAPWSAAYSNDYGYTRMTVHNATHLSIEQVSDDQDGKIVDKMMLVKEKHGVEAWQ